MAEDLRSTKEQLKDEFGEMYERMTDPEARRKHRIKERREQIIKDVAEDAGV